MDVSLPEVDPTFYFHYNALKCLSFRTLLILD